MPVLGQVDAALVTIVIPTYREVLNLPHVVPEVADVMRRAELSYEIIIVDDDSRDGSEECVAELRQQGYRVEILVRKNTRGLSSAVVEGFRRARGSVLVCMDADLSHPPKCIPDLVASLRDPEVDFAAGSRHVAGGCIDGDWGLFRRLNSWAATMLARPLTRMKDPMSGFFALRRQTFLNSRELAPLGYKIGLELIVKCACRNVREIPIRFVDRKYGESKLSVKEQIAYVRHVKRLMDFRYGTLSRFLQFAAVGCTGAVIDLASFNLMLLAVPLQAARAWAILLAMAWNFWLNRRLTFSYSRRAPWLPQYLRFLASCGLGAVANWATSIGLASLLPFFRQHVTVAAGAGVIVGAMCNFVLSRHWVFDSGEGPNPPPLTARRQERVHVGDGSCVRGASE